MSFKTTTKFKPTYGPDLISVYHDAQGNQDTLPAVWLKVDSIGISVTASMTPSEATEFALALMRSSFEVRELIEEIDASRPTISEAAHD
jgi:hypothetical protein